MLSNFPGLGAKGKDVQGLLKSSITLLGKDKDVFKPAITMTIIKSVRILITFFAIYSFFVSKKMEHGALSILSLFIISPVISYFNMRYKAITSWMIFDILRGRDTDVSKGKEELKGLGFTLFLYSIIDNIVQSATTSTNNKEKTGIADLIKGLVLAIFKEVWDLIKNFSLPAIVIDKVSLKEIPGQLKKIKKNMPGALVGILGIDIVGSVFVSLFGAIQFPAVVIGAGMGYFLKSMLPAEWLLTITFKKTPIIINMLPLFIILIGTSIIVSFLNNLVHLVKTTYFTTFYVSLSRPKEIDKSLRKEITHYLNFNDRLEGYSFFKQKTPEEEEPHDLDEESGEDMKVIRKLANTFHKNVAKGISEKKIYAALLKKGYSEEQLKAGIRLYKSKDAA